MQRDHDMGTTDPAPGKWVQQGYEEFVQGSFGNGGQNLYVSRQGILQRIHRFDVTGDGYVDLLFVNSQDMGEREPVHVISDPLGEAQLRELPSLGGYAGAAADLNGDGYDDLVVAHQCNGTHSDVTAYVYYGGPDGLSERHKIELPAPDARGVAIGDFNGDGLPDIAFVSAGGLRIFYQRPEGHFMPAEHTDYDLPVTHLAAADLDGDGCCDLYIRLRGEPPRILWGSADGLCPGRCTPVGGEDVVTRDAPSSTPSWLAFVEGWRPKVLLLQGVPHLFRPEDGAACFYPIRAGRTLGQPLRLDCAAAVSAAVGDINGNGAEDIAVAICGVWKNPDPVAYGATEVPEGASWIYWGGHDGYDNGRRTAFTTRNARDVRIADLRGNGCGDVIVCQGRDHLMNTTECLVYVGGPEGFEPEPKRFQSHDAADVHVARTDDTGKPQVIIVNHVSGRLRGDVQAYVYLGGPDGYAADRRIELPSWAAPDGAISDFNDNGWADILVSNCAENAPWADPGSFLFWGGPDGFDPDRKLVLPTFRAHGSAIGDFRHAGYLDLAVVGFSNPELLIFRGGPNGPDVTDPQRLMLDPSIEGFVNSRDTGAVSALSPNRDLNHPRWLFTADFNNDGWLDLFISQIYGPRSLLLWGGPDGFSMERATWLSVEATACAQAADLTGNGYLDLIVGGHSCPSKECTHDSYVYIYWNGPEGFREDRRQQLPAHSCNSLTVADFNNDGMLDLFATSYNAGRDRDSDSYIYWGKPGGCYSVEDRTRIFGHSACGCLAADFNEDGYLDLAVAHHKTYGSHVGESKVWWNGPDGFNEHNVTKLPTTGPHGMVAVDPGNIMDRGPEEFYISVPHELPTGARVTALHWDAELQTKTWVHAQVRVAPSRAALATAPWRGANGEGTWLKSPGRLPQPLGGGAWLQYRLALGAVNGGNSPRVQSVTVSYG